MDRTMRALARRLARDVRRARPWTLETLPVTLREPYERRRRREARNPPPAFEAALGRWLEPRRAGGVRGGAAGRALRARRAEHVRELAPRSFHELHSIDEVLPGMILRTYERDLAPRPAAAGPAAPTTRALARELRRTLQHLAQRKELCIR